MRRSVVAVVAALFVVAFAHRDAVAQRLLCEQYPGCTSYPSDSLGGSVDGGLSDPNTDPMANLGGDAGNAPQFAVNEQFGSFGGDQFVSTDASMIGDLIGPRIIFQGRTVVSPSATSRFKLSDNQSPIPRNRVFYNYSHFSNAVDDTNMGSGNSNFDIDRHVFGLEKTFFDGMSSFEIRVPFANTTGAQQNVTAGTPFTSATEFGDIAMAIKVLLMNRGNFQMSAGIAGSLPSGADLVLNDPNLGQTVLKNDAVHAGPFMGFIYRPTQRWVLQSVLQVDFVLNGNDFYDESTGVTGQFQDQNLFMAAISSAYWLRQNDRSALISDIAGIVELHYTTSTARGDMISNPSYPDSRYMSLVATQDATVNVFNITAGTELRFGPRNSVIIGAGAPLVNGAADRLFDTEFLVQYNRFY